MAMYDNDFKACEKCGCKTFEEVETFKLSVRSSRHGNYSKHTGKRDVEFVYKCTECGTILNEEKK
jgi:uncharacterized Zn finger protein